MRIALMSFRRLMMMTLLVSAAFLAPGAQAGPDSEDKARQIWQLLDYMAVDYAGAVADGKVADEAEYAEMQEFAQAAERQLAELPETPDRGKLLQQAAALKQMVAARAAPPEVADQARSIAGALLALYPVPVAPARMPSLKQGAALYQAQCASCHGAQGRADGPLAAGMTPPPVAFSDRDRARERSVFALHQTITRGVEGTAMPAFGALSDDERWALAFYVSTMAYSAEEGQAGAALWRADKNLQAAVPTLDALSQLSESALAKAVPPQQAGAALAYLRSQPEAVAQAGGNSLILAKNRLRESLAALENGDQAGAVRLALSAYLDGFEPVEPALAIRDKALFTEIEQAMGAYRAAASAGQLPEARATEARLQDRLSAAQDALADASDDPLGVFLGALTILLREGVEALLVIVAMIAFLEKANRQDVLPVIHAGWVAALAAGGLTWYAATYLVDISGASREMTEGYAAVFAALVLLGVGIWMHQKSLAGRWQAYIRDKLSAALGRQSAFMLFLLAFVTVYREVFETVLFYAALWTAGTGIYLVSGLLLGIVILAVIAWVMLRTSARLPIGRFFAISSALVAVLSVVLIGKGVAALQEAGVLDITLIPAPRIDVLGIYPSVQTIAAQMAVMVIIVVAMTVNARAQKRA